MIKRFARLAETRTHLLPDEALSRNGRWLKSLVGPGRAAFDFVRERGRKVREIMTPDPCTVTEDATLEDIVELMERNHVKHLPVLRGDKLTGIVTRTNLLQAVAGLTREVPDPTADDDHIRNRIISSIEKSDRAPLRLGVTVVNGIVHLSGESERNPAKAQEINDDGLYPSAHNGLVAASI